MLIGYPGHKGHIENCRIKIGTGYRFRADRAWFYFSGPFDDEGDTDTTFVEPSFTGPQGQVGGWRELIEQAFHAWSDAGEADPRQDVQERLSGQLAQLNTRVNHGKCLRVRQEHHGLRNLSFDNSLYELLVASRESSY